MAISQNFLTGRMRKSAGGTRFSTWRGLNIVAAKPISVRQNVTPAVQLNRDKMSVAGKFGSKMNILVKAFYSLGISKTTPFADTVKFFRNRMLDSLKLNPALLANAKFGTGNTEGNTYSVDVATASEFALTTLIVDPAFGTDDIVSTLIIFNDTMSKFGFVTNNDAPNASISLDPSVFGFLIGDKIAYAVKNVQFRPGNDISGKVKMQEETSFTTLS